MWCGIDWGVIKRMPLVKPDDVSVEDFAKQEQPHHITFSQDPTKDFQIDNTKELLSNIVYVMFMGYKESKLDDE